MLPTRPGLRAILLDLDNTLVDRDAALRAWLRRCVDLREQEIEPLLALDRADGASLAALSAALVGLRPGLGPNPHGLAARIRRALPDFIRPDPAITRALTRLIEAKLRLALISNGGPSQRRKLDAAQLPTRLFATVQISTELGHAKPSPAIFQAALCALELGPEQALMIGDSAQADIAGAARLGIATCWLSRGRSYPRACPAPSSTAVDLPRAVDLVLG